MWKRNVKGLVISSERASRYGNLKTPKKHIAPVHAWRTHLLTSMNYADNHCKMSRDLAATKCPLFIEDRIIELEETPQTVRSQGAFTQVFSVDSASELPQCQYVQCAVRHFCLACGCLNQTASIIRLVVAR